ncbi:hypothetical protein ACFLT8_02110 [Chloroflexota bacterium]
MLNALWVVLYGILMIFVVLAVLWLAVILIKKFTVHVEEDEVSK